MNKTLALGVDIGGTNSVFGISDRNGSIYYEESLPTREFETPGELVDKIYQCVKEAGHLSKIIGIGIGAPNGNFFSGTIEFAPNLTWSGLVPIVHLFESRFKTKAILTNDANAAALGELIYGAGRGLKDFVSITLGTGLGSGVIVNENLVYGHDGFACEYGHIRVIPDGRSCGCGRKGCLETYTSATGVVRSITELESEHKTNSSLVKIADPRADQVFEFAASGDKFAEEIVDYTAKILGDALADFACFSSPSAYILFGGIAQSGQTFAKKVKTQMEKGLLHIYKDKIEIRISTLHDKNAAVLGACSLVWKK
jgi:glucokinase